MRILINALSVTNQSGRHVLLGHMANVVSWMAGRHSFVFLYHRANADLVRDWGSHVTWRECPEATARWHARAAWEHMALPRLVRELQIDCLFTPAGVATAGLPCPQVVFCQNPWCLVPSTQRHLGDKVKGWLQRRAYRRAMTTATIMVFNSNYMKDAYRANARCDAKASIVAYQGISEETFRMAGLGQIQAGRCGRRIVSVSAMARHKGVETLLSAAAMLQRKHGITAEVHLVGSWPDQRYRAEIEHLTRDLGLTGTVVFRGHVTTDELYRAYAEARVFCLMSHCESFGIPAVEAQCFGTPVVSSDCCAIPEVCGGGALLAPPNDVPQTTDRLAQLLTDDRRWQAVSQKAKANAERFHWGECSKPLCEAILGVLERRP